MINRSRFGQTLDPTIRQIYNEYLESPDVQYKNIFNILESKKDREIDGQLSGLGLLSPVGELQEIPVKDPVEGYRTTYIHKKFAGVVEISEEEWEDDQFNVIKKKPERLAQSVNDTLEKYCSAVINNAFNTSYVGGDGVQLASTLHKTEDKGGGTYYNTFLPTSDATGRPGNLGQLPLVANDTNNALKTAQLIFALQTNEFGNPINSYADTLIVSPKDAEVAYSLLRNTVKPGASNNEMNMRNVDIPMVGHITKLIVWPWLTSGYWGLLQSGKHQLNFFWRRKPNLKGPYYDYRKESNSWKDSIRFSVGWSSPRYTFWSQGNSVNNFAS